MKRRTGKWLFQVQVAIRWQVHGVRGSTLNTRNTWNTLFSQASPACTRVSSLFALIGFMLFFFVPDRLSFAFDEQMMGVSRVALRQRHDNLSHFGKGIRISADF